MIISFERTPEEYYRLSRAALAKGELKQALLYGEKALSGKGCTEYKVSLAEIFLSMDRLSDAIDLALDAYCHGKGFRSEIYEVLIHALNESGRVYESVYFITRKAKLEKDEEALDAMDEMMDDFVSEMSESGEASDLFVVGRKNKSEIAFTLAQATVMMHRGEYGAAIDLLNGLEQKGDHESDVRSLLLRLYVKAERDQEALAVAEEIAEREKRCAYALYVLINKGDRREYLPRLKEVENERQEMFFAVAAADAAGEYDLSVELSERFVQEEPYLPEAYFVLAAVLLNGGDRERSVDALKRLFALYSKFPATVILKGWSRMKKCDFSFENGMPESVFSLLRKHVRQGAKNAEHFRRSLLTDGSFRAASVLMLEAGDREVEDNFVRFLGVLNDRQVDRFFSKLLLNSRIDPILKRAILAELLFHKDKGALWVSPTGVPVRVPCEKPPCFHLYPFGLKLAYVNVYSFLVCLSDLPFAGRAALYAEMLLDCEGIEKAKAKDLAAAMLFRMMTDGELPAMVSGLPADEACKMLMQDVFSAGKINLSAVRKWAAKLTL